MTDERVELFRTCIEEFGAAVDETIIAAGGWDPVPGSQGALELAAQGPFLGGRSTEPVRDAHSLAGLRLALATEHLAALSRLLSDPPATFAAATVARAVLENAARGSWALDPAIDVKRRIARGRTDQINDMLDVLKYPRPIEPTQADDEDAAHFAQRVAEFEAFTAQFDKAAHKLADKLADTEAIGLKVIPGKRGRFLGVEERSPGYAETIRLEFGDKGASAYRNLSGVTHGGLSSVLHRMEPVEAGSTIMRPTQDLGQQLVYLAAALDGLSDAQRRRATLFGWDPSIIHAWIVRSAPLLLRIFRP